MGVAQFRCRTVAAVASLTMAGALGLVSATPAEAKPDIQDVRARIDALYDQAERAGENYDEARIRLASLKRELEDLKADQAVQATTLAAATQQLRQTMLQQFEGSNLSAVGQVVLSDDPQGFLGQLSTMSAFQDLQTGLYDEYVTQAKALDLRRRASETRMAEVRATEAQLAEDKRTIDAKLAAAEAILSRLEADERDAILSRGSLRLPSVINAEGRASAAISYASAQLGDAYVWGAAGPGAFDCSGLTMMAWAAAGVALPHSSRAQFSSGPHIAEHDLRPGDLVFYYSPISHVGMYIGSGLVLHAARPGEGVKISGLHSMPYVGAVRPG